MDRIRTLLTDAELRRRLLFTLMMIAVFRVLSFIPVPWVNRELLSAMSSSSIVQYANTFTGGALANFTLMATGISAYISASIIIQLLTYAFRPLHDLQHQPGGDKKIKKLTMLAGVIMAFVISLATTITIHLSYGVLTNSAWYVFLLIAAIHAGGTAAAVWIGETITEKGFGNGVSLLIFVNILSSLPSTVQTMNHSLAQGSLQLWAFILGWILVAGMLVAVVVSEQSERRIPVQYARASARGTTAFHSNASWFPIKINLTGVMPIIFASTLLQVVAFGITLLPSDVQEAWNAWMGSGTVLNAMITSLLIFAFSFFYSALIFDPREIADQIQAGGGTIPGVKPGMATASYIRQVNRAMTILGASLLSLVSLVPSLIFNWIGFSGIPATSMMILVGVALELWSKIETEAGSRSFRRF